MWVTPGAPTASTCSSFGAALPQVVEESCSAPEEDRHHRDHDLVEQARGQVLLRHRGTAAERDALVASSRSRLLERRLDPVRDEVERRPAIHLERLAGMVCEDEDRMVERRIVAPPALPRIVVPRPRAAAEHVPAHDGRAGAGGDVLGERCARVDLAAFLAVALAERFERVGAENSVAPWIGVLGEVRA
jgi:hypothetical protein